MDNRIRKYLLDIIEAINSVDEHLQHSRNFKVYLSNKTMRRSVEREVEIIGEATNRILRIEPDIKITAAVRIVDQRNLIIHAYDSVNNEMIWNVVVNYLPKLKEEVQVLLAQTT